MEAPPPVLPIRNEHGNAVTWKLLFIAARVALLQLPLFLVNVLRQERGENRARGIGIDLTSSSGARRAERPAAGVQAAPEMAYIGAAVASSALIVCYSATILRSWLRATTVAALLTGVHSVLFVVLHMENFALLAGTGAVFAALAAIMFFTRNVDWFAQDAGAMLRFWTSKAGSAADSGCRNSCDKVARN